MGAVDSTAARRQRVTADAARVRLVRTGLERTNYDNEMQRLLDAYVRELEANRAEHSEDLKVTPVSTRRPEPSILWQHVRCRLNSVARTSLRLGPSAGSVEQLTAPFVLELPLASCALSLRAQPSLMRTADPVLPQIGASRPSRVGSRGGDRC